MPLPGPDDQHMPIQGPIWVTLHVLASGDARVQRGDQAMLAGTPRPARVVGGDQAVAML